MDTLMLNLKTPSSDGNNSKCGAKEVNINLSTGFILELYHNWKSCTIIQWLIYGHLLKSALTLKFCSEKYPKSENAQANRSRIINEQWRLQATIFILFTTNFMQRFCILYCQINENRLKLYYRGWGVSDLSDRRTTQ